ncbi:hypothetical protein IW261DRAFT_1423339 [Armillaria novae-zelandiae]|uniref:Uncharacterized protein n=1 Tax=Armillaria novae-zelandiae TaxID=153914 RepID=A0AA39NY17_9AGAR|nr:hypothetical protein IW261DRAFT_1423339 [Armillaria novae-zelandiae]
MTHPAPRKWRDVYDAIKAMRSNIVAPVAVYPCKVSATRKKAALWKLSPRLDFGGGKHAIRLQDEFDQTFRKPWTNYVLCRGVALKMALLALQTVWIVYFFFFRS